MKYMIASIGLSTLFKMTPLLAALTPEQTLVRALEGQEASVSIINKEGVLPVEYVDAKLSRNDLPWDMARQRTILNTNSRVQDPTTFGGEINLHPLGPYEPMEGKIFYVPYIPMPVADFLEYFEASNLSKKAEDFFIFEFNGVRFFRFFIHPSKTSSYSELIAKYGLVRDDIVGYLAGSPRTFYVFDPNAPESGRFKVKTSLHFKVNNDIKNNIPNKLHRSVYVNAILNSVPDELRAKYNFDFLPEVIQALPRERQAATFIREVPSDYSQLDRIVVPGYYLNSPRSFGRPAAITEMLSKSRDIITDGAELFRPLLRLSAFLMFEEGLKGELHEQNVDFEIQLLEKTQPRPSNSFEYDSKHWGVLTGKLFIKDLDSFNVDTELRVRKKKFVGALRNSFKPFINSKFSKATGWGDDERILFDQDAYDAYIRDTFGYSFAKRMGLTERERQRFYTQLGQVMAEEVSKVVGFSVQYPRRLEIRKTWLNEAARKNRENHEDKISKQKIDKALLNANLQEILKEEFFRLRSKKRATALLSDANHPGLYFLLHQDLIEARVYDATTKEDEIVGMATLETVQSIGEMQFEAVLKMKLSPGVYDSVQRFRQPNMRRTRCELHFENMNFDEALKAFKNRALSF